MPLSPTVSLGRLDAGPVVSSHDVRQRSDAEWPRVALIDIPRCKLHIHDRVHYERIAAECEPCPLLHDSPNAQIRIPGEPGEAVEVCHGQRMTEPVRFHSHIGNADEASHWMAVGLSGDNFLRTNSYDSHADRSRGPAS